MKNYIFFRYQVREYTHWRTLFENFSTTRKNYGEKSCQIFHDVDEMNLITILCEWINVEQAKKFIACLELSENMQFSGVMEQPIVQILIKE